MLIEILTAGEKSLIISTFGLFFVAISLIIKLVWNHRKELENKVSVKDFEDHKKENESEFEGINNLYEKLNEGLTKDRIAEGVAAERIENLTKDLRTAVNDIRSHVQQYNKVTNDLAEIKGFMKAKCKDCDLTDSIKA